MVQNGFLTSVLWNGNAWDQADLSGTWFVRSNGKAASVAQVGGQLLLTNENGVSTPATWVDASHFTAWGQTASVVRNSSETSILWNGNAWGSGHRYLPVPGYALDAGGALWRGSGSGWQKINSGVVAIAEALNGAAYYKTNSGVYLYQPTAGVQPLSLGTLSNSQWTVNQAGYPAVIMPSGGYGIWTVNGLPAGLSAASSGNTLTFNGSPTQAGTFSHIAVTWAVPGVPWATVSATFSMTINPPPRLSPASITQWTVNQPGYAGRIPVSGGTGTYSHLSVTGLPPGLMASLSGSTVLISGTPTQSGMSGQVVVSLQDATGATASGTYSLTINPPPSLGRLSAIQWTANQPQYPGAIPISGGTTTYRIIAGTGLPPGLSPVVSGTAIVFTGIPTQAGSFGIALTLQDSAGATASGTYTLTVAPASFLTLGPAVLPAETAGLSYSASIQATGGYGSYNYALVSGSLPPGLFLSGSGVLSGTTTVAGSWTFTVQATDAAVTGLSGTQVYSLIVNLSAAPAVSLSSATAVTAGKAFGVTVTARDRYGNGYTGSATLTSSDGQTANLWLNNGTGTSNLTLVTAHTVMLTATAGGYRGTASVVVSPAAADSFSVTAPGSATAGTAISISITTKDAYGNTVTGFSGTVSLGSSNGSVIPPTSVHLVNGTGSVTVTPGHSGSATLTASSGAIRGSSGAISVNPSLYVYTFTLYAYENGDVVATNPDCTCLAQNDSQANQYIHNQSGGMGTSAR